MKEVANVDAVAASIKRALSPNGDDSTGIAILEETEFQNWSTSPAKVIRCRLTDGTELSVFCKFDLRRGQDGFDHRQGLQYESWFYRHFLEPLSVSTPKFLGTHSDSGTGDTWLLLEYLEGCTYPSLVDAQQLAEAARWIARFHTLGARRLQFLQGDRLTKYDRDYYLGWAHRTAEFTQKVHERFPWLPVLCDRFSDLVDSLCRLDPTVIHGEYYHKNILFREDKVYPIDWESAALGPGVIDLAALIDGFWPTATVHACCDEYVRTRWPDGGPEDFRQGLYLAKLYLHFRWLGSNPEWTIPKNLFWRIEEMLPIGKQLGLL